jgi:4-diphosphocytidyl-2-C-methyl-D-erythritol kinase
MIVRDEVTSLTLRSPAKINLCLSVRGKREDGYHEVEMVMQMVGLYDEVTVSLGGQGIAVSSDSEAIPSGEGNIAGKAARAVLDAAGAKTGASIAISKNIPVAAGLGGGSGNAAAVLVAVNALLGTGYGTDRLAAIGATIGMDVPFFLSGPLAVARGRGEQVISLPPMPSFWVLLVNPGFETSTAWAYKNVNLRLTKKVDCTKIARLTVRNMAEVLHNDLEAVTATAHPEIGAMQQALRDQGALGVRMSGSGPTVFGIFETESACRTAATNLIATGWRLFPVESLTKSPFAEHLRGVSAPSA